jgi:hypothetical protein
MVADAVKSGQQDNFTGLDAMLLEQVALRRKRFGNLPSHTQALLNKKAHEQYGVDNYVELQNRCEEVIKNGFAPSGAEQTATLNIANGELPLAVVKTETIRDALEHLLNKEPLFDGEFDFDDD